MKNFVQFSENAVFELDSQSFNMHINVYAPAVNKLDENINKLYGMKSFFGLILVKPIKDMRILRQTYSSISLSDLYRNC